jgi:asparagine synthase (glutamine-hydrolysing)
VEKWVLRRACQGLLPDSIAWREKEQFDQGSGTVGLLSEVLHDWTDRPSFER